MGLLDSISRLSLSTDDIFTASNRTITDVGPFTDAVLGKHVITDIIRDVEEGERTLFTHRVVDVGGVKGPVDVRPVAVGLSAAVGPGPGPAVPDREVDVDLLLAAALRLVENYGSMPRAKGHIEQLHDRAEEVRSRISLLEEELEELKSAGSALPEDEPELPSVKDEEKIVVKVEAQLAAAKRRRDALREQLASKKRTRAFQDAAPISTPTAAARTRTRPGGGKIPNPFLARFTQSDPDATINILVHLSSGRGESLLNEGPPQWADHSILSVAQVGTPSVQSEEEQDEAVCGVDSVWANGGDGEGGRRC